MSEELLFISVFNLGGVPLALNHLESLRRQNIKNYKAYVTDKDSYDIVSKEGHNVELIIETSKNIAKDKTDFGTNEFNTLSYIRYKVIINLLNQNKPVWYLDIDTVVLQNLNDVYDELKQFDYDAVMQSDINMLCTGCMLLFPKSNTISLMRNIYANQTSVENDQIIMMRILNDNRDAVKILPLNVFQFPNGLLYFNELKDDPKYRELQIQFRQSMRPIYLVHANWMVGLETKVKAFKNKGLWFIQR